MINTYDFKVEHPQEFTQLAVKDLLLQFTNFLDNFNLKINYST